jgi:hypothetical protein
MTPWAEAVQRHTDKCELCKAAVVAGPGKPVPGNCGIGINGTIPCPHPASSEPLWDPHAFALADMLLRELDKNG